MRVFGNPLHPMLVHFPVALWTIASACDALALAGIREAWPVAWMALAMGAGTAIPAAIAGMIDYARLDARALPAGTRHMLLMGGAFTAYAAALFARTRGWGPVPSPDAVAAGLSALGFVLLAIGGHLGATLVFRHGAGHRDGQEAR